MAAVIQVPPSSKLDSATVSAADIWMGSSGGSGYVQIGWYVGQASQLPYTATPRLFWGENSPDPVYGETLHAGIALTPGAFYSFRVTNPLDGSNRFNVWLQGSIVAQSQYAHTLGYPGFVGEVGDSCTTMYGWASHASSPYPTLQYRSGTWTYFDGTTYPNPPSNYVGGQPHGEFTASGLGPY